MAPRTWTLMGCLILSLVTGSLWGQSQNTHRSWSTSRTSNIEGWQEDERDEVLQDWTWFGIGYEFRNTTLRTNHSIAVGIPLKKLNGKK